MELPDADLKTDTAGKRQRFQKDFFYRLVPAARSADGHGGRP